MKRHVVEIAADARTLEEKLNSLGEQFAFETIVWANGKLFVVIREYCARPSESPEGPEQHESSWRRKNHGGRNYRLPKPGAPVRKDQR